jgi:acetylornithine/succinyldiaminopimelate/putrescine aminotransferase/predicted amino acid dehydrogenase
MSSDGFEEYRKYCKPKLAELLSSLKLDKEYVRGQDCVLTTANGQEVVDFIGGFGALMMGHNHPEICDKAVDLIRMNSVVHSQVSVHADCAKLAKTLSSLTPGTASYCVNFSNSGTESVEAAVKHAYKVHFDKVRMEYERLTRVLNDFYYRIEGEKIDLPLPGSKTLVDFRDDLDEYNLGQLEDFQNHPGIIAFKGSFHGKTTSSLKMTFNKSYREGYEGLSALRSIFVDPREPERIPEILAEDVCTFLYPVLDGGKIELRPIKLSRIIALILETVQGEGGIRPISDSTLDYLANQHGHLNIPYIIDEIQTGCGRLGSIYSFSNTPLKSITPEYIVLSKALGGGLVKIGATLIREDIYDQDFGILHTSTFGEDDFSASIALKFLEILSREDGLVLRTAIEKGDFLKGKLQHLGKDFPDLVKEVRGHGLLLGLELTDLRNQSPFFRASGKQGILSILIASYLLEHHGIRILAPLTTMLKGNPGKNRLSILRIQPPVTISESQIEKLIFGLREVFEIIRSNNEFCLIAHLMNCKLSESDRRHPRRLESKWPVQDEARHIDSRTGFIVHPTNVKNLKEYYFPSFAEYSFDEEQFPIWWNAISRFLEPIQVKKDFITSNDFVIENSLVFVPYLPEYITAAKAPYLMKEMRDKVQDAVILAKELGDDNIPVSMVGLGAYTSIITNNGLTINDYEMCITTGNAYTTALTLLGLIKAAESQNLDFETCEVSVVGAGGNIGQVVSQLLSLRVGTVNLVGSGRKLSAKRLMAVKRDCLKEILLQIRKEREQGIDSANSAMGLLGKEVFSSLENCLDLKSHNSGEHNINSAIGYDALLAQVYSLPLGDDYASHFSSLCEALFQSEISGFATSRILVSEGLDSISESDMVVLATNSHDDKLVTAEMVKPGGIVCCTSVPANLSPEGWDNHLAFDGGLAKLPEDSRIRFVGMPRGGNSYGCLAETLLLGFDGHNHSFSKGVLSTEMVHRTLEMADIHGFALGELRMNEERDAKVCSI